MDSPNATLKNGFLVKKYKARHCWKTRWFVLDETCIRYFRKKDRFQLMGSIKLRGAAVSFPVENYEKRTGVFKVSDYRGKEYLLRAPNAEERGVWTHAIGAIIRALDSTAQGESSEASRKLSLRVNLSDLFEAMQDPEAGLSLTSRTAENVEYQDCFAGSGAVNWLLDWNFVTSRELGVCLCRDLLRLAHFQPVLSLARHRTEVAPKPSSEEFYDSPEVFYRFSSMMRSTSQEMLFDSSDSSMSSSGEKSEGDLLRDKHSSKVKVVRESFLMKRGHRRRQWKARKIVLLDNPPTLKYYSAAKDALEPLKVISLDGCQVKSVATKDRAEFLHVSTRKRPFVFCIVCPDGKILIFQAENEHDQEGWVKAIAQITCQQPDV